MAYSQGYEDSRITKQSGEKVLSGRHMPANKEKAASSVYDSPHRGAIMNRHSQITASAFVFSVSLLVYALSAHSQQRGAPTVPGPAPAAQPAQAGQRGQALPGTETGW